MDIKRYIGNDKLAELELQNLWDSNSEKERIEITKKFNGKDNEYCMPILWAELIAKKGTIQEKITLAKCWRSFSRHEEREKPIIESLVNNDNMLVRCAFYENPESLLFSFGENTEEMFKKLTHVERLAFMRNPQVNSEIILKIFDINNKDFILEDKERKELILSFCMNEEYIEGSKKHFFDDSFLDGFDAYSSTEAYPKLYDKAFDWVKKDPHIAATIYKTFSCNGEKKLEIYRKIKDSGALPFVRAAIFESIPEREWLEREYNDLYKEGLSDEYDWIRYVSAARYDHFDKDEINKLLNAKDAHSLEGLLRNESLAVECMKQVIDYIEKNNPDIIIPDVPAIKLKNCFKERYYKKIEDKKQDPFYFTREDDTISDVDEIEDLPKESYKLLREFKEYFKEYINKRLEQLHKKLTWIYWIAILVLLILIFGK